MRRIKGIVIVIIGIIFCYGCESREPLYLHMNVPSTQVSLNEYKYFIITKAIDDERNKDWFQIKPTKVFGEKKSYLLKLINSFIDERYNWHGQIDIETFGDSQSIYTQRFIDEMKPYVLNKYIPYIVNEYKLTSIIDYASIMPEDYVQKKVGNGQSIYRIYAEISLNVKSSSDNSIFNNEMYLEGSNAIAFLLFVTEEDNVYKVDGWYEMIQGIQGNLVIPYWSKSDAENNAI